MLIDYLLVVFISVNFCLYDTILDTM